MSTSTAEPPVTLARFLQLSGALHLVVLALLFAHTWLDDVARGHAGTALRRLIEEATGAGSSFVLGVAVFLAWRRWPLTAAPFRRLPGYLALALVLGLAHTTIMWGARVVAFPLAGLGAYDYGRIPFRYLMELPASLLGFTTMLAALALFDATRARRAREQRAAALEQALVSSQLQALRSQLQPHFLFNALNTIAARIHDDPVRADALLGQLASLLHATLRTRDRPEHPLADELELLDAYLALLHARFGDRLDVEVAVAADVAPVRVPPLVLQLLVENAVRHGGLERTGRARVRVAAVRDGDDTATIDIWDDGPPPSPDTTTTGTGAGMSSLVQRLALLHGDRARLVSGPATGGGFHVRITLPAGHD
ncbi:MAG: sensor histidine kinase [Gemmatimonadaceae bacterium]|jgi:signal transduction histidine kinase|nr:sensor histidine kinase [Gemmatimonadaceae bacterium]